MLLNTVLVILVIIAVIIDIKQRRIPNWIIITGIIAALFGYGYSSQWHGIIFSLKGLVTGMMLLLLPYIMGGFGAGDVKLLGMVGALKGSVFVFNTFLGMAIAGGVIAIIILWHRGLLKEIISRLIQGVILSGWGAINLASCADKTELSIYFPYGTAILIGVLIALGQGWWG